MALNATRHQGALRRIEVVNASEARDFGFDTPNAVIPQGSGNFTFVPAGGTSEVTLALSAGNIHAIAVGSIPSTNAVQVAVGWSV